MLPRTIKTRIVHASKYIDSASIARKNPAKKPFPYHLPMGQPVASTTLTHFKVSDLPELDRYSVWKESISVIFDVEWESERPGGFAAEVTSAHLGNLLFAQTRSLGQHFSRPLNRIHQDGLDLCLIQVYLEGQTQGLWGNRAHSTARTGDVLFLDAAQIVDSKVSDFTNFTLMIPRGLLAPYLGSPEHFHGRILTRESVTGRLLAEHLRMLWSLLPELPATESAAVGSGLVDLVGRYFRSSQPVDLEGGPSDAGLALREVMRGYIESALEQPDLGAEKLAARYGVSRSTLYNLFKPLGGVSRYIWGRRLHRAHAEILAVGEAHRNITAIALRLGFNDLSHFSRAFREKFGYRPSEAHEACRSRSGKGPMEGHPSVDRSYEDWIRGLT